MISNPASNAQPAEDASSMQIESLQAELDSVYFLMSDGWEQELESNRWHYARRWARHLPVVLLQPDQRLPHQRGATAAAAIENCEVLPIMQADGAAAHPLQGFVQAAQVMDHMAERVHSRPLLWCYHPPLATLYAALPAVARVYHASENYFDYEGLPEFFYRELEAALRVSDLVIPVSSGVANAIRSRVPEAHVELVTNGCDTSHYQPEGSPSSAIASAGKEFERVAVFAGNVNGRIDFEVVGQAAASNDSTLIVFAGPVSGLDSDDAKSWEKLQGLRNVRHLERMGPEQLAALYRSSDLGFIPYRREERIVRNGFPLKTLEMAATGLPVVASKMEPIVGLASAIAVAETDEEFLNFFASLSRSTLKNDETLELLQVAAANDYDRKFEQVVSHLAASIPEGRDIHTRLDDLLADFGYESWHASCKRLVGLAKPSLLWRGGALLAHDGFTKLVPADTRHRLIPPVLRKWARSRVTK
jgi:glycosyltransferase involved in cell wall biosynthesis